MKRIIVLTLAFLYLATANTVSAQVVGANTQRESLIKPKKEVPDYRPTGGFMAISSGFYNSLTVGTQLTPSLMVAGGIGFNYIGDSYGWERDAQSYPLFVEARFGTPKYRFSLFVDARLGLDLPWVFDSDIEWWPVTTLSAGITVRNISVMAGINLFHNEYYGYQSYRSKMDVSPSFAIEWRIPFESINRILF